jgi:regulator of replication initiation timing
METSFNQILNRIALNERNAQRRAIAFTFIPLIAAILLITYTSQKVIKAQQELNGIESRMKSANDKTIEAKLQLDSAMKENFQLRIQNDSLKYKLIETTILLGKQVSVFTEFKQFIDNMKSYDRSYEQAAFWINFRMLEDKIRGNYEDLSENVATLPKLDENNNWIVIVQSSTSLDDLKLSIGRLVSIYGKNQVAIYKDKRGNYALSIKGNGTFTRAYRLNVELRDKYNYEGAYFSGKTDWGPNYLNE